MATSQQIQVNEARRTVVFTDGSRLELSNVTAFNSSGTWLRLWSDEGYFLLNTKKINYHQIQTAYRSSEADQMAAANKPSGYRIPVGVEMPDAPMSIPPSRKPG